MTDNIKLKCDRLDCTKPAVSSMGSQVFCEDHFKSLMAPIRARVFTQPNVNGVGKLGGVLRPEYGPLVGELECTTCQASWVGSIGEPCWWCARQNEIQLNHQAEIVLQPPDVDPSDQRFDAALAAWAARLIVAVHAGVITKDAASVAYNRQAQRAA